MTCTGCAQSLEKLLRGTRGVESADASFMGSRAVVVHDPTLIDSSAIAALMSKLNFVGTVSSSRSNDASGAGPATVVVALGSATNFEHLQSLKLPCVASARYDAANSRATIDVAESFKRRDVIDALAAAELPHELFDAAAAAAATSEAAEAREAMVWKIHLVLSIVIAIPLALIAFVFVDDVSQLVRVIVGFVLCSISQLRIGYPLYVSAYKSLRYVHEFNMDCLVMLSTTIAYVYSTIASIVWLAVDGADESVHVETYFETPAILLALIVIGRWLEKRAKHKTGQALRSIRGLQAPSATLIKDVGDDSGRTIDCALIDAGDLLRLVPGDRVPVDGVVVRGTTTVDEAMVTGESRPQVKQVDSKLIGGTSNIDGCVVMRAEAGVQESTVAQIVQLMSDAQDTKPSVQLLADKIASVFVPVIMVLALVVFGIWLALVYGSTLIEVEPNVNPAVFAMRFAIALLVVSCPCAVALAAPTVVVVAAGVAARHGLLLKNGESLERLHRVTDVLFDKTGTITRGELRVVAICAVSAKGRTKAVVPSDELDDASARLLDLCASAENGSEHSLARGIEASAKRHLPNWTARATSGFRAVPGQGVVCEIDGVGSVVVGTPQLLEAEAGVEVDEPLSMRRRLCEVAGDLSSTIVYVSVAGSLVGALALADTIRPEAAAVIKWLTERRRVRVWMVTGDNEHAATAMANVAGVANERVVAGVSPAGKAEHVRALQANGGVVCHVGDGVNDAVALTQADIGLAMSSGTDVASSAADIVLMKNDLRDVVVLLDLARAAVWRIRINLGWAFIYNLLAMPLAAGAFYPLGRVALEPGLAGASELLSSLPVVLCSVLLARYRPPSVATME